jgi:hypothetical protein
MKAATDRGTVAGLLWTERHDSAFGGEGLSATIVEQ